MSDTLTLQKAANPSNSAPVAGTRKRIPMSVPMRRLEVPDMPGFHLHWFKEINVPRAQAAAYEFVEMNEVSVNQTGVATSGEISGSADLGNRVRVLGGVSELSHPEYLVLMKLREEYWNEDRAVIDQANAKRMGAIFNKEQILDSDKHQVSGDDQALRYVSKAVMNRPARKASPAR